MPNWVVSCVCTYEIYFKYFYVGRKVRKTWPIKCKELSHSVSLLLFIHFGRSVSRTVTNSINNKFPLPSLSYGFCYKIFLSFCLSSSLFLSRSPCICLFWRPFRPAEIKTITQRSSLTLLLLSHILLPLFRYTDFCFKNCLCTRLFICPVFDIKLEYVRV